MVGFLPLIQGCGDAVEVYSDPEYLSAMDRDPLDTDLSYAILTASGGQGNQWLILPDTMTLTQYRKIPQAL